MEAVIRNSLNVLLIMGIIYLYCFQCFGLNGRVINICYSYNNKIMQVVQLLIKISDS